MQEITHVMSENANVNFRKIAQLRCLVLQVNKNSFMFSIYFVIAIRFNGYIIFIAFSNCVLNGTWSYNKSRLESLTSLIFYEQLR